MRNAAATWSLRDRPAWILRPTSPSRRSIAEWTSSSESRYAVGILRDLGEARLGLVELLVGQQARRGKAARVLGSRLAVVRQELGVVDAQEAPHVGVERALDPSRPRRHAGDYALLAARALAAWSSVSSDEMRMKPSAASCGNVSPVPYEASSAA